METKITRSKIWRFKSHERAVSFANRCKGPMVVMLGDHPEYWVVTMADAQRLEKQGYEVAR